MSLSVVGIQIETLICIKTGGDIVASLSVIMSEELSIIGP